MLPFLRRAVLTSSAIFLLCAAALPAAAHHGWSWTTGGNIKLTGLIREARLGNPHGELKVDADGEIWTVEVGQPWRNERAGLTDADFAVGNELTIVGEPAADPARKVLKAERILIDGQEYPLYPSRN
ncbi:MAG: DUF6152 family protein [Alphaproteobacteria bacterium]|nr:DUF6152 family protein [Alphaproteobacteria bacterium]